MPPPTFSPGVIDYSGRMSTNFQSGRALSPEAASTWAAIVAPFVRRETSTRILDLGAGTGRFSRLFACSFEAQVIGIEPSTAMLAATAGGASLKKLTYVAGSAEGIPLRSHSCDLVWLSHVWHHIRDRDTCARELHRVVLAVLVGTGRVKGSTYHGDLLIDSGTCVSRYGTLADARTLRPVAGATVSVGSGTAVTLGTTVSGPNGWYRVDLGCPTNGLIGFNTTFLYVAHPNYASRDQVVGRGVHGVRRLDLDLERR
jgi:SAM-dependent methyltransferase